MSIEKLQEISENKQRAKDREIVHNAKNLILKKKKWKVQHKKLFRKALLKGGDIYSKMEKLANEGIRQYSINSSKEYIADEKKIAEGLGYKTNIIYLERVYDPEGPAPEAWILELSW